MKLFSLEPEITFDDVLLLPNRTTFSSRDEEEVVDLTTNVSRHISLKIPIVSAPMPGVTETEMAIALGKAGGLGFIHFYQSFELQLNQVERVKKSGVRVVASVAGDREGGVEHVGNLLRAGVDLISVISWHADNPAVIKFVRTLKKTYKDIEVVVGVVATADACEALIKAGADGIQVGIGGGSHCTTRLATGVGRPQLSAVSECAKVAKRSHIPVISDTGIKHPGDIAKALVFGADCVMIGGLFAGTDESPGNIVTRAGEKYKYSWGMATETAMTQGHIRERFTPRKAIRMLKRFLMTNGRRSQLGTQKSIFEEGVEGLIEYKGEVRSVLDTLVSGVRRSMWYQGVKNIPQLRKRARVVLVSETTQLENMPRI